MAETENIGGVSVSIVGDYSKLQSDIDQATQIAAQGGQEIAEALSKGAAGADALSSAVAAAASGMGSFESQIEALVNSGSTLAEALVAVSVGVEGIASGVGEAGSAAAEAAEQMLLFDEAISVPYADAAGQLNMFADELEPIGESAAQAAAGLEGLGQAVEETIEPIHQFSAEAQVLIDAQQESEAEARKAAATLEELQAAYQQGAVSVGVLKRAEQELADTQEVASKSTSSLVDKVIALGAGYTSAKALLTLGEAALEAADAVDDAAKAMTLLGGSAEQTAITMEQLRILADDAALGFPELLIAANRMTAFLGSTEQVPDVLRAVADSAAVMHTSIEAAAGGMERIVASGDLSQKSLQRLGLKMEDVAAVMGVSGDQMKKAFKGIEDDAVRVDIMIQAMDKFKGAAKNMSDDSIGAMRRLKNQWNDALIVIGTAFEPVIHGIVTSLTGLLYTIERWAVAWSAAVKSAVAGAQALAAALRFDLATHTAQLSAMDAAWSKGEADLKKLATAHEEANKKQAEGTRLTEAEIKAQVQAALAREAGVKAAKQQQEVLDALIKSAKEFTTQLPASYDLYAAKLTEGGKTAQSVLGGTEEAIRKTTLAMEGMRGKPLEALQAVVEKLQAVHDRAKAFAAEDVWNKQAQQIATFAEKYADQLGRLDASTLNFVNNALRAARDLDSAFSDAQVLEKWAAGMQKLADESDKLDAQFKKMASSATKATSDYADGVLKAIPITVTLRDVMSKSALAAIDLATAMHKAGLQTATDLENQLRLDRELMAGMIALNQPLAQRLELQGKILTDEIKIAEQSGASATKQIVALEMVRIKQQALYDSTHMMGELYVNVLRDIEKGYDMVGKAIVDSIIEGKNFGDAMLNVGKQITKMILEDLVATAFKALKGAIVGVDDATKEATKSLSTMIKAVKDAFAPAAAAGAGAAKTGATTPEAVRQGAGGGGAGTLGTISSIADIATAISSIIGNFQMYAMNKSLDLLVNHTLRIFNVLDQLSLAQWERHDGLLEKLDMIFNRLGDIWKDMVAGFGGAVGVGGEGAANTFTGRQSTGREGEGVRRSPSNPMPGAGEVYVMVPPAVFSLPSVPFKPKTMEGPSPDTYSSASNQTQNVGTVNFNIHESSSPRETARKVAEALKMLSPKFAAYST